MCFCTGRTKLSSKASIDCFLSQWHVKPPFFLLTLAVAKKPSFPGWPWSLIWPWDNYLFCEGVELGGCAWRFQGTSTSFLKFKVSRSSQPWWRAFQGCGCQDPASEIRVWWIFACKVLFTEYLKCLNPVLRVLLMFRKALAGPVSKLTVKLNPFHPRQGRQREGDWRAV